MEFLRNLRDTLWGPAMLCLMLACGLALALRTRFVQVRRLGTAIRTVLGSLKRRERAGAGELTPFQSLTAALAATVGTGNIAGVTAAVTLGGPGALAWMWAAALLGMGTKYGEVLLAVHTRRKGQNGEWRGGPMYYMPWGLGRPGKVLAAAFCLFGALAALGIGSAVQAGTITETAFTALRSFLPGFGSRSAVGWGVGILCAASAGFTLLGGVKRLGQVTERLVPAMAGLYILACLGVILLRAGTLLPTLGSIFAGALNPRAVTGGAVGGLLAALSAGVRCGVFSNEAGLGSAPMAYAASGGRCPAEQGLYGIFEVFADTLVICTLTGLSLLMSGIPIPYGTAGTAALNAQALGSVYGPRLGPVFLALSTALFALATILSWSFYGLRCWEYLLGSRSLGLYRGLYVLACLGGAVLGPETVWALGETLNGLMCLPNLMALLVLSPRVGDLSRSEEKNLPETWKPAVPFGIIKPKTRRGHHAVYRR